MNIEVFNHRRLYVIILLIMLIANSFFLRIYKLDEYPSQINQDELSNIYDAYSISETGADRWGMQYPIILRAFGDNDYRPPMYSWIAASSIKLFGVSVIAGRLPSVIIGLISLLILFVVAKKIGGELFAFLTFLIASLSPWHIIFSRLALEAAVLPSFFMILSIYLWLKLTESLFSNRYVILLAIVIGLAANSYQSSKLIFFILAILTLLSIAQKTSFNFLKLFLFSSFLIIGAMPQIVALVTMPDHFFARANGTMIEFSFTLEYFFQIFRNLISCISPVYLFYSFGEVNTLSIARLLTIEALFFYLGIIFFFKIFNSTEGFQLKYLYVILVVALLPSALTMETPHALRESSAILLYPMFSAAGILVCYNGIKNTVLSNSFFCTIILLMVLNFIYFTKLYFDNSELSSSGHQSNLAKMAIKLAEYKDHYSEVLIEDIGNQPYIYVAYYCNIQPSFFQKAGIENAGIGWDHIKKMDKYYFLTVDEINAQPKARNSLIVLQNKTNNYILIDTIYSNNASWFFYEPRKRQHKEVLACIP